MLIKEWIKKNCFTKKGKLNNRVSLVSWWNNKGYEFQLNQLKEETFFINTENITQRIYHILNDLNEIRKCVVCGKPTSFQQFHSGYREHCSIQCSWKSKNRIDKIITNTNYELEVAKAKKRNLEKYGVESTFQLENVKEKIKNTKKMKYGDEMYNNMEKNRQTYGTETLFLVKENQRKSELYGSIVPPKSGTSKEEIEIGDFLNSLSSYRFEKNKTLLENRELDFYCEELKLAIEYCGLYWHSDLFKKDNYHYEKYKKCLEKNINLITIFEDEWKHRKDIVKDFIRSKLGIFEQRIYARECSFVEHRDFSFFNENHIQGRPNTIKRGFCLVWKGEIVGSVSFSKHHRNYDNIVLSRLAFKKGVQVIGGTSKLIKNALQHMEYSSILTWSDNRFTDGELYRKNGFRFVKELRPDYSYYKNDNKFIRYSKQNMTKTKINCPKHLTEREFCASLKYFRIYDCGKKQWIKES